MSLSEMKKVLKKNNFLFNTHMLLSDKSYLLNFFDYFRHKHEKPGKTVWNEVRQFCKYWKSEPFTYFKYRMFEKNLTSDEMLDYIPAYFFYNVYIPSIYLNKNVYDIGGSKIKQSEFFHSRNIPAPREIATIINGVPYSRKVKITFKDLLKEINESNCRSIFMKPDLGKGGKGILRLEKKQDGYYLKNEIVDENLLSSVSNKKSFLLQEGVIQRKDFSTIYDKSVNTVRFVTQNLNNKVEIIAAVFRTGQNGNFVDNVSSGGLDMMINVQTGALDPYASDNDFKPFRTHPDTGFRYEGYIIPGWDKIVGDIISYCRKAPDYPHIAWDTAVTDEGLKVLEFNINYGFDGIQNCIGGLRRKIDLTPAFQH
ncbi:MAG TPA: sugar-transfer associated ATP-grasp domain-containing protein [Bacteroidales bacterium]|nr:sugar-transfer associated ATP-grasp domain-containing protein [Bacteroidales bacterium]